MVDNIMKTGEYRLKPTRQTLVFIVLASISAGSAIHWTLAMLFYNGIMDVNALHNKSGWAIGEGWFEAVGFAIAAYAGFKEIPKLNSKREPNP